MRKILSLLLLVAMCCILMVSCADAIIGADLPGYLEKNPPKVRESVTLDFYIVTDEATTAAAITTVVREINTYLNAQFKTTLDIHFITPDTYVSETMSAVSAEGDDRADIVHVAGKGMFDQLYAADALVPLNTYFLTKEFGRLNSSDMISKALIEAASVAEGEGGSIKYVVPNNRIVGSYDYIMINREMAHFLNFSTVGDGNKVSLMTSVDAPEYLELVDAVSANEQKLIDNGFDPADCIKLVNGASYLAREEYVANGYVCNVASSPVVTAEEAHESSFAIIAQEGEKSAVEAHYTRCMEIIYALNTDEYLRNLVQYGVKNTHYTLDDNNVVTLIETDDKYVMYLESTGNIFTAYYNTVDGANEWTEVLAEAGKIQNKEAVSE
ncbi:MAG: hypothetical protein IKC32_07300 [Clostridia bacterium]|nr:hypothetical protein [Clostridia bacterium]